MRWFFNWLYNGIKEVEAQDREESSQYATVAPAGLVARNRPKGFNNLRVGLATAKSPSEENHVHLNQSSMNFRLYAATGGHIVEYSYYDEKTDRNTQALHLIASDQDLGDSLSKIMTLEALRR